MSGYPNHNVSPGDFFGMNNNGQQHQQPQQAQGAGFNQGMVPQSGSPQLNPAALAQFRTQTIMQQHQHPLNTRQNAANAQLLQQLMAQQAQQAQQQQQQQSSPQVIPQAIPPNQPVRPQQAQIAAVQNQLSQLPPQYRAAITSGRMTAQQALRQYFQARSAAQQAQAGGSSPITMASSPPQVSSPQTPGDLTAPTPPQGTTPVRHPSANALPSAIPQATPSSFQLDASRLKTIPMPDGTPTAGSRVDSKDIKKKPAAPAQPPSASAPVYFNAIDPSLRDAPRDKRPEIRFVEPANEYRKRGTEGMRGSMRNELARLMYAAGDVAEPDLASVDYMEDLVVEFLADLCRPVPPIRPNPQTSHQPVPLTTSIVRHRLASRPVYRKYLDRFDTMHYLSGELARSRRIFNSTESHFDLVETVGRNYLEIDSVVGEPKKRGRPRKEREPGDRRTAGGAAKGEDGDEKKERKKPGPKKGWKAARVAAGIEVPETRFESDGRKVKRPYKRRKKDESGTPAADETVAKVERD